MNTCCDSSSRKSDLKLTWTENVIPFSSLRCYSPVWNLRPVVRFPFPHPEGTPGMSDAPPPVWNLRPVVRFPFPHPEGTPGMSDASPPVWNLRPVVRFPFPHPEGTPGMSDAPPPVWNLRPVVRLPIPVKQPFFLHSIQYKLKPLFFFFFFSIHRNKYFGYGKSSKFIFF